MKAKPVRKLDPEGPFDENARRIVRRRLGELEDLARPAIESGDSEELHDVRIAAKRLRYVLELCAPALGPGAAKGAKTAKQLQGLIGEIHDCDELAPRVRAHIRRLRREDAEALRAGAGARARDLDPEAAREAPHRGRYRGLHALLAYVSARRAVLLERLRRDWARLEERDFGAELLAAITPTAPEPPPPPDAAAP
jgi:hypothetical protein